MTDYGTADDPILVPGSLVVFRHFKVVEISTGDGLFGAGADWWYAGDEPMDVLFRQARQEQLYARQYHLAPMAIENTSIYRPDKCDNEGWFMADCAAHWILGGIPEHTLADCRCGFYAHYHHLDDFYPAESWHGTPIVYAAVEMAGTTVCGSKGVRAERMRVLALTADWRKYRDTIQRNLMRPQSGWGSRGHLVYRRPDIPPAPEQVQQVQRIMRDLAGGLAMPQHRIAVFRDVEDLWKAYPEPDRSWEEQ